MAQTALHGLLELLYPRSCVLCRGDCVSSTPALCESCAHQLSPTGEENVCWRCAANIGPFTQTEGGCDLCREEAFGFDRVLRLGRYEGLLRMACLRMKELRGFHIGNALGWLAWRKHQATLSQLAIGAVVPIPLHWRRRIGRGYNQVLPVAQFLGKRLEVPCLNPLRRIRPTQKQFTLAPTMRKANLRNAFVSKPIEQGHKVILLIDDILTSGATCHQAARALRSAGATRVIVLVLGRGDHVSPA